MGIVIRVLAVLLLAGSGYRAFHLYEQIKGFWPSGRSFVRGLDALLSSLEGVTLTGAFVLAGVALSLFVALARKADGDGGKPGYRFDPWAKFFAALALLGGLLSISRVGVWLYSRWRNDDVDALLKSPQVAQILGQVGFELAMGLVTLMLVLLVLPAPRSGGAARKPLAAERPSAPQPLRRPA